MGVIEALGSGVIEFGGKSLSRSVTRNKEGHWESNCS